MAPGVVVGGVLLASDQLLGVEELPVGSHFDLVHHGGLQIDQDRPGDVFPGARLREESVEAVIGLRETIRTRLHSFIPCTDNYITILLYIT